MISSLKLDGRRRSCAWNKTPSKCGSSLAHAIITDREQIPPATRQKLDLLLGKYL